MRALVWAHWPWAAVLGMWIFRHKTRHWYFKYGLPALALFQGALAWRLLG